MATLMTLMILFHDHQQMLASNVVIIIISSHKQVVSTLEKMKIGADEKKEKVLLT